MGTGEGINAPCHVSLTARWMPKKEHATAMSFYCAGQVIGIIITMPLAVWIIQNWGWQTVFYSFAFIGVAWCIVWCWYGKDRPELHPSITRDELQLIKSDQDPPKVMDQPTNWRLILTNRSVWGLACSYFFYTYVYYLYMTWLPTYLAMSRGFDLVKTGIFAMLPYIVSMVTMYVGGWWSDKLTTKYGAATGRRVPITIGFAGCGIFLILATNTPNAYVAVAYISASIGFLTLGQGGFWSMPMDLSAKDGGVISGIMNTLGTAAGVFAPTITGFIVSFYHNKFENALYFGAGMTLLGIVVLWVACKVKPFFLSSPEMNV
jgi:sugar phosphate permease